MTAANRKRDSRTYVPVFLDLQGRYCVVVGGGRVAERKAQWLLDSGAKVAVVAPELTPKLRRLADYGEIICAPRSHRSADFQHAVLAIAASDDAEVNRQVARDGDELGIPVNVVDDVAGSSAIMPAVLQRGPLTVAVSTGGAAPGLATRLRDELEECIERDYGAYVELLELASEAREIIEEKYYKQHERAAAMERILDSEALDLLRDGRRDEAEELVRQCI